MVFTSTQTIFESTFIRRSMDRSVCLSLGSYSNKVTLGSDSSKQLMATHISLWKLLTSSRLISELLGFNRSRTLSRCVWAAGHLSEEFSSRSSSMGRIWLLYSSRRSSLYPTLLRSLLDIGHALGVRRFHPISEIWTWDHNS